MLEVLAVARSYGAPGLSCSVWFSTRKIAPQENSMATCVVVGKTLVDIDLQAEIFNRKSTLLKFMKPSRPLHGCKTLPHRNLLPRKSQNLNHPSTYTYLTSSRSTAWHHARRRNWLCNRASLRRMARGCRISRRVAIGSAIEPHFVMRFREMKGVGRRNWLCNRASLRPTPTAPKKFSLSQLALQ